MSGARRSAQRDAVVTRALLVRFRKHPDGRASLTCIRADGSTTWQKQRGASALFFPLHDLTHYAVETVLGLRNGFYAMVADGWDMSDFGTPWPRGPMRDGADLAEVIVGLLDLERAASMVYPAAEYREKVASYYARKGEALPELNLTDANLDAIRSVRDELFTRLDATPPDGTLELRYPPSGAGA